MPGFLYTWVPRLREIWTAVLGEVLITERELHNVADCYAVAVKKHSGETVGHLPRKISRLCSMFIDQGGDITCVVTGNRRYSSDLAQGGLEIPCSIILPPQLQKKGLFLLKIP